MARRCRESAGIDSMARYSAREPGGGCEPPGSSTPARLIEEKAQLTCAFQERESRERLVDKVGRIDLAGLRRLRGAPALTSLVRPGDLLRAS